MSKTATSFVATKENLTFIKQFKNRSKFLNELINRARQESQKKYLLEQYNNFAESEEMSEWLGIANNSKNL